MLNSRRLALSIFSPLNCLAQLSPTDLISLLSCPQHKYQMIIEKKLVNVAALNKNPEKQKAAFVLVFFATPPFCASYDKSRFSTLLRPQDRPWRVDCWAIACNTVQLFCFRFCCCCHCRCCCPCTRRHNFPLSSNNAQQRSLVM